MPVPRHREKVEARPHFMSDSKLDIKNYQPNAMFVSLSLVFEILLCINILNN